VALLLGYGESIMYTITLKTESPKPCFNTSLHLTNKMNLYTMQSKHNQDFLCFSCVMAGKRVYAGAAHRNACKTSFKVSVVFVHLQPKLKQLDNMYIPQV